MYIGAYGYVGCRSEPKWSEWSQGCPKEKRKTLHGGIAENVCWTDTQIVVEGLRMNPAVFELARWSIALGSSLRTLLLFSATCRQYSQSWV